MFNFHLFSQVLNGHLFISLLFFISGISDASVSVDIQDRIVRKDRILLVTPTERPRVKMERDARELSYVYTG